MTREQLVDRLHRGREAQCVVAKLPPVADRISDLALGLLFPHFAPTLGCETAELAGQLQALERALTEAEALLQQADLGAEPVAGRFLETLPELRETLIEDARSFLARDPAAKNLDEVVLAYPGFHAIACHRVAHALHGLGMRLVPRLISERAHRQTGVDIHPGARIGRRFVIDHGTGVVIGETAQIGAGVTLYQGVTLGALAVEKELANQKRHPTIEDHVVIYANATILGGQTVIGHDSVIGGNAWLTQSVPPYSQVTQSEVRRRVDKRGLAPEFQI